MLVKNSTNIKHILLVTYKRMCYKIDILLYSIQYIITVFLCQRRQVDSHPRNIHTFTTTQDSLILHFTKQMVSCFINHTKFKITIINKNRSTDIQIMYKIGI